MKTFYIIYRWYTWNNVLKRYSMATEFEYKPALEKMNNLIKTLENVEHEEVTYTLERQEFDLDGNLVSENVCKKVTV